MEKFDLSLNFNSICTRVGIDMENHKSGEWADMIGVSKRLISNVHGKKRSQNPPIPYIIAVARHTGKPAGWYLYGTKSPAVSHVVSESQVSYEQNDRPSFCGQDWSDEDVQRCRQLKKILDSKHPVIVPAILSNLAAFEYTITVEKDKNEAVETLKSGMKKKSSEIMDLKKRIMHLEELTDSAGPNTGADEAES